MSPRLASRVCNCEYLHSHVQAPPLFVLEFLHRIIDVFHSYFGEVDEMVVKRNFSTVYQVRLRGRGAVAFFREMNSCGVSVVRARVRVSAVRRRFSRRVSSLGRFCELL